MAQLVTPNLLVEPKSQNQIQDNYFEVQIDRNPPLGEGTNKTHHFEQRQQNKS